MVLRRLLLLLNDFFHPSTPATAATRLFKAWTSLLRRLFDMVLLQLQPVVGNPTVGGVGWFVVCCGQAVVVQIINCEERAVIIISIIYLDGFTVIEYIAYLLKRKVAHSNSIGSSTFSSLTG